MAKQKKITKRAPSKNKTVKKPKVGDTVYIKGDEKCLKWLFEYKITVEGKELAYCTTVIPKINGEPNESLDCKVPLDWLSLTPPPNQGSTSQIFIG